MARIIVLGGCGVVGSIAVKTLVSLPDFTKVIIGDINIDKAHRLAEEIKSDKVLIRYVNASDRHMIKEAIKDVDVVLNCIGPFYIYGPKVLKVAIEAHKNYVDINDDVDATQEALKLDDQAKQANISALIGMGSSPGVTNLLAKFASNKLLDEVDSIDLYHAHGGEPVEGAGVIYHRIHSMSIDIPIFDEGEFKSVKFFEADGKALQEVVEFHKLGSFRVHPYPHPETITLPANIKGVKRVTNKGTVLPPEYFYLITELVKLGLTDETPINVKGELISPLDFTISYILDKREKILKKTNFGIQRGCVKIVVKGKKSGNLHQFNFSLASEGQAMGEGTGLPAAFGALLMQRGLIKCKGVFPPEACVEPLDFLNIMQEYLDQDTTTGGESPLTIESIDAHGNTEQIRL